MKKFTNNLIKETSPYLLQHAHNPVDWYPWGEEAFTLARKENKPVFLSVGYSSCHWCHVMEHESFENEEIARVMNENFVNIKVDREERPDIDQLYMQYVQLTTGSGGWPMSVFLTPDQKPFYGGTYFPPQDGYGRPGFKRVLQIMADYFHKEKDKLSDNLAEFDRVFLKSAVDFFDEGKKPDVTDWNIALQTLAAFYEPVYGGIGNAPKFPAVTVFNLFLRHYKISHDENYLQMVRHTLKNMAQGGIYDQLAGGFARYSVDEKWLVPHFEKMLYDNGQLVSLFLDTYILTKDGFYTDIAEETLAFISREMTSPEGGFYSSMDADSEGKEGKYYVWTLKEIYDLLGKEKGEIFGSFYGVTIQGNFEGHNILHVVTDVQSMAAKFGISQEEIKKIIVSAKEILLQEREKRVRPGLDDKIIASWNGLMLSAYARAYQVTRKKKYAEVIKNNILFLQGKMYVDGILKRTYKDKRAKYDAFIEDYAFVIQALLDAWEALFDPAYLSFAVSLADYANRHFWDDKTAGYYTTSDEQEQLVVRMKDTHDSSIPAATGVMLMNNLRLFSFTENKTFNDFSEQILKKYADQLSKNPYSYASYLAGLDFYLEKPKEIVIVKNKDHSIEDYMQLIYGKYLPNKIVMVLDEGEDRSLLSASLIRDKKVIDGKAAVYICHNFNCSLPVIKPEELNKLL